MTNTEIEVIEEVTEVDPKLQAIIDAAAEIEAELEAETSVLLTKITANLLARFNLAKKTGINLNKIIELGSRFADLEFEADNLDVIEVALWDIVEATAGKKLATEWLEELEGQRMGFMKPVQDMVTASAVKKA